MYLVIPMAIRVIGKYQMPLELSYNQPTPPAEHTAVGALHSFGQLFILTGIKPFKCLLVEFTFEFTCYVLNHILICRLLIGEISEHYDKHTALI